MKKYEELCVGDFDSFTKTIGETDVYLFAGITGDFNPAHINEKESSKTKFGGRIVHGMLTASFISNVIGMKLPGPGAIYIEQNLKFLKPVIIGDTISAKVTVVEKLPKNRIKLDTIVTKSDGSIVVSGTAVVLVSN